MPVDLSTFSIILLKAAQVFDSIVPILEDKVREGVEVRILYDGMRRVRFMPKRRWEELRRAGILVGVFFPSYFRLAEPACKLQKS